MRKLFGGDMDLTVFALAKKTVVEVAAGENSVPHNAEGYLIFLPASEEKKRQMGCCVGFSGHGPSRGIARCCEAL
jgi:hypothetical protein